MPINHQLVAYFDGYRITTASGVPAWMQKLAEDPVPAWTPEQMQAYIQADPARAEQWGAQGLAAQGITNQGQQNKFYDLAQQTANKSPWLWPTSDPNHRIVTAGGAGAALGGAAGALFGGEGGAGTGALIGTLVGIVAQAFGFVPEEAWAWITDKIKTNTFDSSMKTALTTFQAKGNEVTQEQQQAVDAASTPEGKKVVADAAQGAQPPAEQTPAAQDPTPAAQPQAQTPAAQDPTPAAQLALGRTDGTWPAPAPGRTDGTWPAAPTSNVMFPAPSPGEQALFNMQHRTKQADNNTLPPNYTNEKSKREYSLARTVPGGVFRSPWDDNYGFGLRNPSNHVMDSYGLMEPTTLNTTPKSNEERLKSERENVPLPATLPLNDKGAALLQAPWWLVKEALQQTPLPASPTGGTTMDAKPATAPVGLAPAEAVKGTPMEAVAPQSMQQSPIIGTPIGKQAAAVLASLAQGSQAHAVHQMQMEDQRKASEQQAADATINKAAALMQMPWWTVKQAAMTMADNPAVSGPVNQPQPAVQADPQQQPPVEAPGALPQAQDPMSAGVAAPAPAMPPPPPEEPSPKDKFSLDADLRRSEAKAVQAERIAKAKVMEAEALAKAKGMEAQHNAQLEDQKSKAQMQQMQMKEQQRQQQVAHKQQVQQQKAQEQMAQQQQQAAQPPFMPEPGAVPSAQTPNPMAG